MTARKNFAGLTIMLAAIAANLASLAPMAEGQAEEVLYTFSNYGEPVVRDASGNFYGVSTFGGWGTCYVGGRNFGCGTVFELARDENGSYQERVLHNFQNLDGEGVWPQNSLVIDSAGNLYGTTSESGGSCFRLSCGTVFELTRDGAGGWAETVLHNFTTVSGGMQPWGVVLDSAGNIYGTTARQGGYNGGNVFELLHGGQGEWREKVLHSFDNNGVDGANPQGGPILDASGNLYGTTYSGGRYCTLNPSYCGTVYELVPSAGGGWAERVLHNFGASGDAGGPVGSLNIDALGNLYGLTDGGAYYYGSVYELTSHAGEGWTEKVLWSFGPGLDGGIFPQPPLAINAEGHVFGGTQYGGTGTGADCSAYGCGTLFELVPDASGACAERVLINFSGDNPEDGYDPGGVIIDAKGDLYGLAAGGTSGFGILYEATP